MRDNQHASGTVHHKYIHAHNITSAPRAAGLPSIVWYQPEKKNRKTNNASGYSVDCRKKKQFTKLWHGAKST